MFYRKDLDYLRVWAKSENRKPIVMRGARQVGKTTLADEFGKEFEIYLKLNLENSEHLHLFETYTNMETLLTGIYFLNNRNRKDVPTLLFIDEIQNSPRAVSLVRYFYEEYPNICVITAGSLLESLIEKHISFPVGRVEYMSIRPCTFNEFLGAMGKTELQKAQNEMRIPSSVHQLTMSLFNQFTLIGGMPEIVAHYAKHRDVVALAHIYDTFLTGYRDDTEKYAPSEMMRNILRHIVSVAWNYAAQRITFVRFGNSDYRSREVGEAFRLLEKTMLLELAYPYSGTKAPIIPELKRAPKLLCLDTGIVNYVAGLQKELIGAPDISDTWRGRVAEQVVSQELIGRNKLFSIRRSYWVRNVAGSEAEVDFTILHNSKVIPIEVKSGHNSKLKSLHLFMDEAEHSTALRIWSGEFSIDKVKTARGKEFNLYNVPFYYTGMLEQILDQYL